MEKGQDALGHVQLGDVLAGQGSHAGCGLGQGVHTEQVQLELGLAEWVCLGEHEQVELAVELGAVQGGWSWVNMALSF